MRISETWTYPTTPEQVWAVMCDTGFQDRKCAEAGATAYETSVTPDDRGGAVIRAERTMPTEGVPDQFRSLVGSTVQVVETQTWHGPDADGSRTGSVDVRIQGAPLTMTGDLSMRADTEGTTLSLDGKLKARIPLLGGKIEKSVAPLIVKAIRTEARVGAEYL